MKSILNSSKWAIAGAIVVLPFFMGCSEEPAKTEIDTTKKATVEVNEEEMKKPQASVGIAD